MENEDIFVEDTDSTEYDDLFCEGLDEEVAEETTEETETSDEDESADKDEKEEESDETTEDTIDFKFLGNVSKLDKKSITNIGKTLNLDEDAVVAILQKGMNYDKAITNTELHKIVKKYAEGNEMTLEEYTKFLADGADNFTKKMIRNKIEDEHPEWDDEKIDMQVEIELNKKAENTAKEAKTKEDEELKPYMEFIAKYPDVKEFPPEVAEALDKDKTLTPIYAYESYLLEQKYKEKELALEKKYEKIEHTEKNKKRSTGSMKDYGDSEERDWFIEGLNS